MAYVLEVYTDGKCPLCQWVRAKVEPLDSLRQLRWFDYNDPSVEGRAAPELLSAMADEMHVRRLRDGRWFRGFEAWIEVLQALPGVWRLLSKTLGLWPFRRIGPALYRWIAHRRYKLFGVPPPCDSRAVCSLHRNP